MDKEAIPRRGAAVLALAVALALALLAVAAVVASPKAAEAAPPEPADETFIVEGACDFPVRVVGSGKFKDIALPGGDILRVFPASRSTLTNLEEPSNRVTLRGGGKGRITFPSTEGGDLLVTVTGHNVLVVPGEGIFEVRKATFTLAPPYDVGSELTILERRGKLIDLCARLS
jgi:hypothetical protein